MLRVALAIVVVFVLLIVVEFVSRIKKYHPEITRKFLHIVIGTFVAFWPWFLSWRQIELLAVAFLFVVLASRTFSVFGAIHKVERKTFGELCFAISIGLLALLTHDRLIFAIAMLNLSLADGLAAVVGIKFGQHTMYRVFGRKKSVVGTAVFWVCSLILLIIYCVISHTAAWPALLWLPLAVTLFENIGIDGTDNILVPLAVAIALRII